MYLSPAAYGERAIIYNAYEPEAVAPSTSLLHKDYVVFDIGAWIGNYTLLAARPSKLLHSKLTLIVSPELSTISR